MATIIVPALIDEFVWNKLYIRIYNITLAVYATNGYTAALGFSPGKFRLKTILGLEQIGCDAAADLIVRVAYDFTNNKLLAYQPGGGVFTGTTPIGDLNLATPAFSGTGLTAAGQVMTTTDNQTMTLNQCAGMWLMSATGATPPMLILSNTAVAAAPAVFTVKGAAATDAGAYKVVANITPVGTLAASNFAQIANGIDLTAVKVRVMIFGR